jgi:hypothetical protein
MTILLTGFGMIFQKFSRTGEQVCIVDGIADGGPRLTEAERASPQQYQDK